MRRPSIGLFGSHRKPEKIVGRCTISRPAQPIASARPICAQVWTLMQGQEVPSFIIMAQEREPESQPQPLSPASQEPGPTGPARRALEREADYRDVAWSGQIDRTA